MGRSHPSRSPQRPSPAPFVFALANLTPEIDPVEALATGRSDFPNQINNVLAFPGFFRGLLDGALCDITDSMLIAATAPIADRVSPGELNASYITPASSTRPWLTPSPRPYGRPEHSRFSGCGSRRFRSAEVPSLEARRQPS